MEQTGMLRISVVALDELRALAYLRSTTQHAASMKEVAEDLIQQAHAAAFSAPSQVTIGEAEAAHATAMRMVGAVE